MKVTNKSPFFCPKKTSTLVTSTFGAGSIFRHIREPNFAVVWGSGIISLKDDFEKPKKILAVRGPLTRRLCIEKGFTCPELYGDPAILLPKFYSAKNNIKKYEVGLIPHYINYQFAKEIFGQDPRTRIIDVTQPVEKVIDDIVECKSTVSGSLHGLIVSHAYDIPSTWIEFGEPLMGDGTKFHDYFGAFEGYKYHKPFVISGITKHEDLVQISLESELPDQDVLRTPLLRACPFWKGL